LTDTEIPVGGSSDDILSSAPPPADDDSPTIVSKNSPKPPPPTDDGIRGRRLAHFELLEQIGAGGMAAVLRARDTQLDRIVALKILPPDMAADPDNVLRFHQEARSAAKLDHENIARVFFCGEDQRLQFIAFEFVEGENLRTILERRGRLPVHEALPYVLQIAAGLAHAAERGVVHRDIKPSNIIITPSGRAKLVDMGLARSLGPQKDNGLTQSGVTLGTFDYISPEQALEPRDADVRSDIYSLGCTFYHMVTGRAPVPEGTAARKLHCHQHVPPTDPRELVHGLPDEVALILDRMMAKDPRARYQTAGELVQHLLTAAKKLRVGAEVPEGVLFVETPLPRSSGGRPYLLVGLAVAAVVALIMFLDQPANTRGNKSPKPPGTKDQPGPEKDQVVHDGNDDKKLPDRDDRHPVPVGANNPTSVRFTYGPDKTPQNLFDWLEANRTASHIELFLARDLELELGTDGTPELLIAADEVTVQPAKDAPRHPTIRLTYKGGKATEEYAALRIRAKETRVTDIQFVVDARESNSSLIGLALEGESHHVRGCDFVQIKPSLDREKRTTSLFVARGKAGAAVPRVELIENTFLGFKSDKSPRGTEIGGQDAVARRGAVRITAKDCAFGPHQATFRLDGDETVHLDHCSVMAADQSAVFHLVPGASATFDVRDSLFSRPGRFGPVFEKEPAGAVVVRLADERDHFTYKGTDNRYHNLTTLPPSTPDDHSFVLKGINPWEYDRAIETPGKDLLVRTFTPKRDVPELRQPDAPNTNLIGVETISGQSLTANLPRLEERPPDQLTVDPAAPRSDSARGVFTTLEAAVAEAEGAKPGETKTIWIRSDGIVTIGRGIRLERRSMDLVIKAAPGTHPVLLLGQSSDRDAALFRLHDGRLQLEDLELRLLPPQPELGKPSYLSQAIVALMGEGRCSFRNCLITLDQNSQTGTALAVATLPATDNVMKMDMKMDPVMPRPEGQRPHLSFTNCFVRGTGDLVWSQTGRPCDVDANRLLVALSGSFCDVDVTGTTDLSAPPSVLKLDRTTTFLGGPLLRVQGKDVKDAQKLPQYRIDAGDCLFLPAANQVPLVRFETQDGETDNLEEKLLTRTRFSWDGGKTNGFGDFDPFLAHLQINETTPHPVLDFKSWQQKFAPVMNNKYRLAPADGMARETSLRDLKPSQLRVADQLDLGADTAALQKLLPAPR
jgi:serine/threonine protein kinase